MKNAYNLFLALIGFRPTTASAVAGITKAVEQLNAVAQRETTAGAAHAERAVQAELAADVAFEAANEARVIAARLHNLVKA